MAHYEKRLTGNVTAFIDHVDQAILSGSVSSNAEGGTDVRLGDARMVVRIYERYSAFGGNRVSLSLSVLSVGEELAVSASTSGGSQAVFLKINTVGESTFLDRAIEAIESFAADA